MISIKKSPTADTRTCDATTVSKEQLLESSKQHIDDVHNGLVFFAGELAQAACTHDFDKVTDIDGFHADFTGGNFMERDWIKNHYAVNRHHVNREGGIRDDVNLVDIIEHVVDVVMAGMARSGEIYPVELPNQLLQLAVKNTVAMLKEQIEVIDADKNKT